MRQKRRRERKKERGREKGGYQIRLIYSLGEYFQDAAYQKRNENQAFRSFPSGGFEAVIPYLFPLYFTKGGIREGGKQLDGCHSSLVSAQVPCPQTEHPQITYLRKPCPVIFCVMTLFYCFHRSYPS